MEEESKLFINQYCNFYCLSYKHSQREQSMKERFASIGVPLIVYDGVQHDDPRLSNTKLSDGVRRLWSITYGHLDMIQMFLNSDKEFGIFMENDILVRKDLVAKLPGVIDQMNNHHMDFCLLGYMIDHSVDHDPCYQAVSSMLYTYPGHQWGVHLYMMNRAGAKSILAEFADGYADKYIDNPKKPFSPDWTVSKCPGVKSCLLFPMLAVEDGSDSYEHYAHDGQYKFHMETFRFNYIPEVFI
jgi:hypothetical protein